MGPRESLHFSVLIFTAIAEALAVFKCDNCSCGFLAKTNAAIVWRPWCPVCRPTSAPESTGRGLCSFSGKQHFQLTGSNRQGIPWTSMAQPYPAGLCRDLAFALTSPFHYQPTLENILVWAWFGIGQKAVHFTPLSLCISTWSFIDFIFYMLPGVMWRCEVFLLPVKQLSERCSSCQSAPLPFSCRTPGLCSENLEKRTLTRSRPAILYYDLIGYSTVVEVGPTHFEEANRSAPWRSHAQSFVGSHKFGADFLAAAGEWEAHTSAASRRPAALLLFWFRTANPDRSKPPWFRWALEPQNLDGLVQKAYKCSNANFEPSTIHWQESQSCICIFLSFTSDSWVMLGILSYTFVYWCILYVTHLETHLKHFETNITAYGYGVFRAWTGSGAWRRTASRAGCWHLKCPVQLPELLVVPQCSLGTLFEHDRISRSSVKLRTATVRRDGMPTCWSSQD